MISTTWSCTTRTVSSPAPVTAMQRSKTATDLGAPAQAAEAATPTAPVGKRRSSTQHLYAKLSNSHPTPRPTATSTTSHPILVVDRRATEPASLARTARAPVMGPSGKCYEKNCEKTFATADERKAHFIQEHGFTSKPTTPPLKSSPKDGKGNKVKFVKSQRLVGKVHRVQTKTPKRQPTNDSEDNSDSRFGSDSSMSVEAAPRALIWRNDTSSSKKGRKVSHLRNVSTIHSVRKSRRLSEKRENDKPDSKVSSEPEAVILLAGQTAPAAPSTSSTQLTSSTQSRRIQRPADTAETRRRREEEYHGYSQEEPRPRFENE